MKYKFQLMFSLIFLFITNSSAESKESKDYSLHITVIRDTINNKFTFIRDTLADVLEFNIWKKLKTDEYFGYPVFKGDSNDYKWEDSDIESGIEYEYGFETYNGKFSAWQYLSVVNNMPLIEKRGRLIILADSSVIEPLRYEIERLRLDIISDGWKCNIISVPRAEEFDPEKVKQVKELIVNEYNSNKGLDAVFLLGRVPVPYSGQMAIDGHRPEHYGAWPADAFYCDIDGVWTDTVNYKQESIFERQWNTAGDGKFDSNVLYSPIELECGRVDFYNMPVFEESELELLKRYLDKNHLFRHKLIDFPYRAVIDDKFGMYSNEAFASNAWSNFGAMFEKNQIDTASIRSWLNKNSALWSYGCNAGGINSCMFVAYSDDYVSNLHQAAFQMLFGSWFGDWDTEDNLLRCAIASRPSIVASIWSGRPFWMLFNMANGATIGYSTKKSTNNSDEYPTSSLYGNRMIHIALMGDPSLRMHIIDPPKNVKAEINENQDVLLTWEKSKDKILGYNVYYSQDLNFEFQRINNELISEDAFIHSSPKLGKGIYFVKAVDLHEGNTGSYYNSSAGNYAFLPFYPLLDTNSRLQIICAPNPFADKMTIVLSSNTNGNANIELYNSTGMLAAKIFEGELNKGANIFNFDGKDNKGSCLSQGAYYLKIKYGNKTIVKPIIKLSN